jgi:hypothetical protein
MATAKDILDRARSQLGAHEVPAGSNHTKYNDWYGITGPWCAMFVSWCFFHEGLPLPASVVKGFAYTPAGAAWFQRRGRWSRTPKPGHIVFFDWPNDGVNRISHVGIVESVRSDGTVICIEGNTGSAYGGSVMRRERRVGIVGYGVPDYAPAADTDWFARADDEALAQVIRGVLNEGTAYGQLSRAGTSKATLATFQRVANLLTQQVIPALK